MGGRSTPLSSGQQATGKGKNATGSGSGGGGGAASGDQCPISLPASVAGPATGITQGSWLDVHLDNSTDPHRAVLFDPVSNQIVGALAGIPNLALLLRCLADGVIYRAYVAGVEGGRIDVTLSRQD